MEEREKVREGGSENIIKTNERKNRKEMAREMERGDMERGEEVREGEREKGL